MTTKRSPQPVNETLTQCRQEIKKLKASERQLRESEQRFRHIFENSPVMVYRSDYNGRILDINRAGVELLGYGSREDLIGQEAARFLYADPKDRLRFQKIINRTGFVKEYETRFRRHDGSIIDVQFTSTARRNHRGEIVGYEGFIVDITRRKEAEKALVDSEEKYRTVVENSLSGIFIHQKKLLRFVNRRLAEMLGYSEPGELMGQPFWLIVHPDDRVLVKRRGLKREKSDFMPDRYPFRAIKKDGSPLWVELRATHATYMGEPAVVGNFIDITQSKRAEEEVLLLSRRLIDVSEEEKKRLAADLHDEFGQALTSLHFEMEAMLKALPPELDDQRRRGSTLITTVEALADTVRKTTSYLRPDILDDLGLVPAMEWYIQEIARRRSEVKIDFRSTGFKRRLKTEIEIVLYRIGQECITNILRHARASEIEIMLTCSHPSVIFVARDNGVGFVRSESSPPAQNGPRGIGLLSMRERVASLQGSIDITSAPGRGTTIRVELPLS
jgi:PAS domain S-box-containing protein